MTYVSYTVSKLAYFRWSVNATLQIVLILSLCLLGTSLNADNGTAYDLVFTYANQQIVTVGTDRYYAFDVMAKSGSPGQRLGTGILLINYNNEVFGHQVFGCGNAIISRGDLLLTYPYPLYGLIVNDNSPSRLAITFEYLFMAGWGSILTAQPQQLVHVRMKLQNHGHNVNLSFASNLMASQQYMDNNQTLFQPVVCSDIDGTYLPLAPSGLTISTTNGLLQLQWQEQLNCTYTVLSASSGYPENWQIEATELTQPYWTTATTSEMRFYRVIAESTMGN